jgi:hypothetical protein
MMCAAVAVFALLAASTCGPLLCAAEPRLYVAGELVASFTLERPARSRLNEYGARARARSSGRRPRPRAAAAGSIDM